MKRNKTRSAIVILGLLFSAVVSATAPEQDVDTQPSLEQMTNPDAFSDDICWVAPEWRDD